MFRYYDPDTGRYITADPIGLAGGANLFSYVEDDPINLVDPLGLMSLRGRVLVLIGKGNYVEAAVIASAGGLQIAPKLSQLPTTINNRGRPRLIGKYSGWVLC